MQIFLKRSFITLYFAFIRPSFVLAQSNMTSACNSADILYSIAYVTVPNMENAKIIGKGLVQKKLAACVNIIPQVTSIYEWKGELNEDNELLLMIKTRTSEVDRLTEYVRSVHPYEVCEVISVPIQNGNPPYLKWIGEQVPVLPESGIKSAKE